MISIDKKAPAFKLFDQNGKLISLKDYLGENVVLYFYPKDDTSGCTAEACSFRDDFSLFKNVDSVILGVSPDSIASHKKFQQKYSLPFTLLSDESKEVVERYGVWKEKSMYGRKYMGVERTTIIIDKKGVVQKIFPKVKVAGHNKEVLMALNELSNV